MIPRLTTARLVLDAFTLEDLAALVELAGHPEIFATTLLIPHPYTPADGQRFIAGHLPEFLDGNGVTLAVRYEGRLVGCVGLKIDRAHDRGTLGYWIGRPYWGQGFATEAARAAVKFSFEHFQLEKVMAYFFNGNVASGRVMEKIGMAREGFHPRDRKKGSAYVDQVSYGLVRAAAVASGLLEGTAVAEPIKLVLPPRPPVWTPDDGPPPAEFLVRAGEGSVERALVQRHFLGWTRHDIAQELRVYGKSLAADFARLSPGALAYYLPAAQAYFESEDADGDWDFAYGFVAALAAQLRAGDLPAETRGAVIATVRFICDRAERFFLEADKEPVAGWLKEALGD